jgi:hypothetical protein
MAQQSNPNVGASYAENNNLTPQFTGGSLDPTTGNLIPPGAGGMSSAGANLAPPPPLAPSTSSAGANLAPPPPLAPSPAPSTTQLGSITADSPSVGATLGAPGGGGGGGGGPSLGSALAPIVGPGLTSLSSFLNANGQAIGAAALGAIGGYQAKTSAASFVDKNVVKPVSTFFSRAFHW